MSSQSQIQLVMRILSSCPVTPIFLVFLTIARLSSGEADNGIVSQVSADPLHVGNGGQIPTASNGSPVFSPINNGRPISPFRPPLSNDPQRNGISDGNNGDISDVIAENVLQFGLDIAQKLNELDPSASRSEIFSPLSVLSALSLLMLGAKGKSYQELTKVIGIENSPELASNPSKYHELFGAMVDDMEHFDVNDNGKSSTRKHPNWWHSLQNMITRMGSNPRKPEQIQHTINVANGLFVQNDYSLNPDYR